VEEAIRNALVRPHDPGKVAADVRDMRQRIAKEKGTENIWEMKQVRGGLVDLEFIAQYLQLVNAAVHPGVLDQNTVEAYRRLRDAGVLAPAHAEILIPATRLVHDLTQILRLCLEGPFDPATAPRGMKELLARAGDAANFGELESRLDETLRRVAALFDEIIG
jgi:glutamate-ammonia-ligase adenylyltransferase